MNNNGSFLLQLFFILLLICLNAFFAAAEISIISLNKNKMNNLAEKGNKKAGLLIKLVDEPSKFFATIQVGITLAGFFASATATASISKQLGKVLKKVDIKFISNASSQIAIIIVTIILAYITLVLGELVPKRIAVQKSEKIAMAAIRPIMLLYKITLPFVRILTYSTDSIISLLGIKHDKVEEKITEEEIRRIINEGEEKGVLDKEEKEMIQGVFDFDDKLAKAVMTPRTKVFAVDVEMNINEAVDLIIKKQYSRVPIYKDNMDNIIGIINMKDLLKFLVGKEKEITSLEDISRKPYFVPETKDINILFRELKESNNHLAILIDEYGGFSGIVTIEDLIEEILGDIFDEYDKLRKNEEVIVKIDKDTYIVSGLISIKKINDELGIGLPEEDVDTLGGFILDLIGIIPTEDKEYSVQYKNITFFIEKVINKRIELIKIHID
ncbi:hemolysin family protein [Clostridium sp. ZS2-4]|uniref:hemolysin family protein n=1 Tax=Clostridium sp. ZS2-4 TaxID=2987703 RepID=UPI00227BC174|nr:hemolysin family protein [Clostridium sp. ZS2-4]MCY6353649.1 hemolysin family protein [Clostridium sp. ZS2-4]